MTTRAKPRSAVHSVVPKIDLSLIDYQALGYNQEYLPGCSPEEIINEALNFYGRAAAMEEGSGILGKTDDDIENKRQAKAADAKSKAAGIG